MLKAVGIFVAAWSALSAQTIGDYSLDPHKVTEILVSREVTAVTLPGPITAIAGADMLIDDGRGTAIEVDEGAALRFQVSHAKGANFFLDPPT
jgi:uncharacterized protein with PhoU and TrkA domain